MPFRPMPSGGGNNLGGGTDWGEVADTMGSIIGTISEMAEEQEQEEATRQPTELTTEEKLKEIEALKAKFRREAENEAEREVPNQNWWSDEDTREVERELTKDVVDHVAKVQLGSFIKEAFGDGQQQTANLSDTAADVMLNLKTRVNGAIDRVRDVKVGLKRDFNSWLDQLKNDIDKVD
ncbi:hypothetical protein [Rhizobium sp. BK176]|uniref:hypothetical protein n=1 Tax=Rhizobium sp. BK176 TaxID=2587071 RepID=UPI0021676E5E|nr:hypothetical protein [Rhizobium sp. BK176]MCS4089125.1 YesN/AraC family two-component response regulator [Rhizobium sp. BK176]